MGGGGSGEKFDGAGSRQSEPRSGWRQRWRKVEEGEGRRKEEL
jgi:hypothetical protein